MNRFMVMTLLCFSGALSVAYGNFSVTQTGIKKPTQGQVMHISISANGKITHLELNDSPAAKALYEQLPLTVQVEPYTENEMIFYPPKKLGIDRTPMANAKAGSLAYYAPWGDVVLFYKDFGSARGLYELGHAISGMEHIRHFAGEITIEKTD